MFADTTPSIAALEGLHLESVLLSRKSDGVQPPDTYPNLLNGTSPPIELLLYLPEFYLYLDLRLSPSPRPSRI